MPRTIRLLLPAVLLVSFTASAFAAQGPGAGQGTAGPLAQLMSVLCVIGLATLGVLFSFNDDGKYGDF